MAKTRFINVVFPLAGLDESGSYRNQRPFTTPKALNVRPQESIERRERGGSRPGLDKTHYTQLGSGNPVNMLSSVMILEDGLSNWEDTFAGDTLGSIWSTASWIGTAPTIFPKAASALQYNTSVGAVRDALTDLDTAQAYQISVLITPWSGEHHGTYQIFARMNDSSPAATTAGISAELTMTGSTGSYSGALKHYAGGVLTSYAFTGGSLGAAMPGWFTVNISGNTVACYWRGILLKSQAVGAAAGKRFGFGMTCSVEGGFCLADVFRIQYNSDVIVETQKNLLVAASNGLLYKENYLDTMSQVSSSLTLASDRVLQAAERAQKLYIADVSELKATGVDGANTGTAFDSATYSDWTAIGINANDYVVVISEGTGVTAGTYGIANVAAGALTLSDSPGASGTDIHFRIERAPKIYDPIAGTLTRWAASAGKGQTPTGCPIIMRYRNRMFLGGGPTPHAWYMSRAGDPLDWDYDVEDDDMQRAIAGTDAYAGLMGEPLRAAIPFGDDYAIIGCSSSLWRLTGDPVYGGQLDQLSNEVGIVDKQAWCLTPTGELVFLSATGIHALPSGAGAFPTNLSSAPLPQKLKGINTANYHVSLSFDVDKEGVNIFLTPKVKSGQIHYWFDWKTKSFWPVKLQSTHEPFASLSFTSLAMDGARALLACRDGYIRAFNDGAETDDTYEIESYVYLGPIRHASDIEEGIVTELNATLAKESGQVTWSVHVADNHEEAILAAAFASGAWRYGTNWTARPRARGGSFCLKLENAETNRRWAMEHISAGITPAGRARK